MQHDIDVNCDIQFVSDVLPLGHRQLQCINSKINLYSLQVTHRHLAVTMTQPSTLIHIQQQFDCGQPHPISVITYWDNWETPTWSDALEKDECRQPPWGWHSWLCSCSATNYFLCKCLNIILTRKSMHPGNVQHYFSEIPFISLIKHCHRGFFPLEINCRLLVSATDVSMKGKTKFLIVMVYTSDHCTNLTSQVTILFINNFITSDSSSDNSVSC